MMLYSDNYEKYLNIKWHSLDAVNSMTDKAKKQHWILDFNSYQKIYEIL